MIWLALYLYVLHCITCLVLASVNPKPRRGWDLAWRVALSPILLPLLLISALVKGH